MFIIIIDGVELDRLELEPLLAGRNDFQVVLSTGSAEEAMNYLSRNSTGLMIIDPEPARILNAPEVKAEKTSIPPSTARKAAKKIRPQLPQSFHEVENVPLSVRETEILELLHQGHTKEKIADRLFISYHTVKTHTKNIYRKLNVCSRSQAVYKFFQTVR